MVAKGIVSSIDTLMIELPSLFEVHLLRSDIIIIAICTNH
jgi:hypothetical protein